MWHFFNLLEELMREKGKYEVLFAGLNADKQRFEMPCDASFFEALGNPDILGGEVSAEVYLSGRDERYSCVVKCKGVVDVPCDRCLEAMQIPVDAEYAFTLTFGEEADEGDGYVVLPYGARSFDFSGIIADTIVLSVPLRHIHEEGKCENTMLDTLREMNLEEEIDDLDE